MPISAHDCFADEHSPVVKIGSRWRGPNPINFQHVAIYLEAASMKSEGVGLETQSTFTPNLLPHGIYFYQQAGTPGTGNSRPARRNEARELLRGGLVGAWRRGGRVRRTCSR